MRSRHANAVVAAVACAACSTHYTPIRSSHLSVTMEGGTLSYVRDGQKFEHGFAGSGLIEAVEGDPEATEAAETFNSRSMTAFWMSIAGLGCIVGGVAFLATNDTRDDSTAPIAVATLGCGLGLTLGGSFVLLSAQPYQLDAINIYNDNALERERVAYPPLPAYAPAGYAPPGSAPPGYAPPGYAPPPHSPPVPVAPPNSAPPTGSP